MLPTNHEAPHGDVPRGKPIHLVTSGLHSQYRHADGRQFNFVPGFLFPKKITHPWTERSIDLSSA